MAAVPDRFAAMALDFIQDQKNRLVIAGVSDVDFRAETFNRDNMRRLEAEWETISRTLCLAAELFSSFVLSRDNINARMVLIPVAYYLYRRNLGDRYLSDLGAASDRQRVRDWTVRALLMPGVWGSGVDTLLGRVRRVIDDYEASGFPTDAIEDAMAAMGKTLRFASGTVDELVNSKYGQTETFAMLSIPYSNVDPSRAHHIDHIFPQAMLRRGRLREARYSDDDIEYIANKARDGLSNLQLLPGLENLGNPLRCHLSARARNTPSQGVWWVPSNKMTCPICPKISAASFHSSTLAGSASGLGSARY